MLIWMIGNCYGSTGRPCSLYAFPQLTWWPLGSKRAKKSLISSVVRLGVPIRAAEVLLHHGLGFDKPLFTE